MTTDSSSGTLPSSRRLTMASSSSIARSKLNWSTSAWVFSDKSFSGISREILLRCWSRRPSPSHQGGDMRRHRAGQPLQVVTAFQHRDDAAVGARVGDLHELLGRPCVIRLQQIEIGERIAHVGVEACRDHHEVRTEGRGARQDHALERRAELLATIAGPQRRVDDVVMQAALGPRAGAGIKWHFVGRTIHHGRIGPEDFLGAVAMVDVEIHYHDTLRAMIILRVSHYDTRHREEEDRHKPY